MGTGSRPMSFSTLNNNNTIIINYDNTDISATQMNFTTEELIVQWFHKSYSQQFKLSQLL